MKIGTLSFEVYGDGPNFRLDSHVRASVVTKVVRDHCPDLLVCAGHTLDSDSELDALSESFSHLAANTEVVLETKKSDQSPIWLQQLDISEQKKRNPQKTPEPRTHGVWLVRQNGEQEPLGPQWFGASTELQGKAAKERREAYIKHLSGKSAESRAGRLFAICCGEISLLTAPKKKGRSGDVSVKLSEGTTPITEARIIVNPTHDLMGYPGLLDNKRRWLSGSNRIYVSASNWNSEKPVSGKPGRTRSQNRSSVVLHTVYVDGTMREFELPYGRRVPFEYREWQALL